MKNIVHHCFKIIIIAKILFSDSEGDKLSQIRVHNRFPPVSGNSQVGSDFVFILLQVPFCSNRWSAPGPIENQCEFKLQSKVCRARGTSLRLKFHCIPSLTSPLQAESSDSFSRVSFPKQHWHE